MEFYNQNKLNISNEMYKEFLRKLENKLTEEKFIETLEKVQEIDEKYYAENINVEELKTIVIDYTEKTIKSVENLGKIQVILPGNPEIVFKLGIEAIRQNVRMMINIDDFCLAQNTLLVDIINLVAQEMKLGDVIKLQNLVKDEEISKVSEKLDMTLCIGNSNDYNRLNKKYKISNLKLYPFNIFEIYSDSLELEEVRRGLFDYISRNQFDVEIYDIDLEIDEVIEEMNRDGYGFCSILLSKDKDKIKKFKESIKSKYVFVNENPFKKIKFELDLETI